MNWRELHGRLNTFTEEELWDLIKQELAGQRRTTFVERLHQRVCALRSTRERLELLKEVSK